MRDRTRSCSIDGCDKPVSPNKGWCWTHYSRWRRHGHTDAVLDPDPAARFAANADKSAGADGCWLWTAHISTDGYGSFHWNNRPGLAHRFAYETFIGPIPTGMEIDHTCHTRACVNPRHLRLTTHAENMQNLRGGRNGSTSGGIRGVHKSGNRWVVIAYRSGKRHYGGRFKDLREAEAAAMALRNRLMTHNDADR